MNSRWRRGKGGEEGGVTLAFSQDDASVWMGGTPSNPPSSIPPRPPSPHSHNTNAHLPFPPHQINQARTLLALVGEDAHPEELSDLLAVPSDDAGGMCVTIPSNKQTPWMDDTTRLDFPWGFLPCWCPLVATWGDEDDDDDDRPFVRVPSSWPWLVVGDMGVKREEGPRPHSRTHRGARTS